MNQPKSNKARNVARERASSAKNKNNNTSTPTTAASSFREMFESLVIAVILAMLVRAFLAEAFVIPTGSMAPTLLGGHKQTYCPQCGYRYLVGDSSESSKDKPKTTAGVCPLCRYRNNNLQTKPYNGDRIIVNKFIYEISDPKRWDVIVFRFPGNPIQNYIKRLVGLPNESVLIRDGDVYIKKLKNEQGEEDPDYTIARKPADKIWAMKHVVADTNYVPLKLLEIEKQQTHWRWIPEKNMKGDDHWQSEIIEVDDKHVELGATDKSNKRGVQKLSIAGTNTEPQWISYHHKVLLPYSFQGDGGRQSWSDLSDQQIENYSFPEKNVGDFESYNDYISNTRQANGQHNKVGDLILHTTIDVQSDSGTIYFRLHENVSPRLDERKSSNQFTCKIDIGNGKATLTINNGKGEFSDESNEVTTTTSVTGPGKYTITFANVDDQLILWVNQKEVSFTKSATFDSGTLLPLNPVDTNHLFEKNNNSIPPAQIAAANAKVQIDQIQIFRDVYYTTPEQAAGDVERNERVKADDQYQVQQLRFDIGDDQFFVMGDNSPESSDGRFWSNPNPEEYPIQPITPFVPRDALIGKALFIYWPRSLSEYFPLCPNIPRMGFVR